MGPPLPFPCDQVLQKNRHEQAHKRIGPSFSQHSWIVEMCPQNEFGELFFDKIFFLACSCLTFFEILIPGKTGNSRGLA